MMIWEFFGLTVWSSFEENTSSGTFSDGSSFSAIRRRWPSEGSAFMGILS